MKKNWYMEMQHIFSNSHYRVHRGLPSCPKTCSDTQGLKGFGCRADREY